MHWYGLIKYTIYICIYIYTLDVKRILLDHHFYNFIDLFKLLFVPWK